ncbi:MAG: hypothetical protein ACFCVF_17695 [Kineosporiaceae bacterium]
MALVGVAWGFAVDTDAARDDLANGRTVSMGAINSVLSESVCLSFPANDPRAGYEEATYLGVIDGSYLVYLDGEPRTVRVPVEGARLRERWPGETCDDA